MLFSVPSVFSPLSLPPFLPSAFSLPTFSLQPDLQMKSISEFLEELTQSNDEMEIVVFFHNNQFAMDTALNIARWLKKDYSQIEDQLTHLFSLGVLEKMGEGSSAIYSYTQDIEKIKVLDRFIKLIRERLKK